MKDFLLLTKMAPTDIDSMYAVFILGISIPILAILSLFVYLKKRKNHE